MRAIDLTRALERVGRNSTLRLSLSLERDIHIVADDPISLWAGSTAVWRATDLGMIQERPDEYWDPVDKGPTRAEIEHGEACDRRLGLDNS